jgi:hypothetical protein
MFFIITILFLFFYGSYVSAAYGHSVSAVDKPPIYRNESFTLFMEYSSLVIIIVLAIIMLFLNWKYSVIIIIVNYFISTLTFKPISEKIIILPIYNLLIKNKNRNK